MQEDKDKKFGISCVIQQAERLAAIHEGECLSTAQISFSHGSPSLKFRCHAGHVFFKAFEDIGGSIASRKSSMNTEVGESSDDESSGSWCTKCEAFYRQCEEVAPHYGFRLVGKLYAKTLEFACVKKGHLQQINYSRRLQAGISCSECRKDARVEQKAHMKVQEELQREECARQQKELFREAKLKMEQEMSANPNTRFESNHQRGYYHEELDSDTAYLAKMERTINQNASSLTKAYLEQSGGTPPTDSLRE
jgi:hypothetical protein